jgi:hypothetical protein
MTRKRRAVTWTTVALAAVLWACSTDSATRPKAPEETVDRVVMSRGGFPVPESRMRGLLAKVTRELAIALADPTVRAMVYKDLHASPYREHKLHFGTFLRGDAHALLSGMAAARSGAPGAALTPSATVTTASVLATLDTIVDLEFYMPVREHYAAWDGGEILIVASALDDDGSIPVGFDLAGRPVTLSASEPPTTPALVVVPVETDFSRIPSPVASSRVNAADPSIAGVHMTRSVIYADHEGWPNGNPEFEVHLFQVDVDLEYNDMECVGELRAEPYTYNTQETQDWSGDVVLATEGRIALSPQNQFQVWEDDGWGSSYDPCTQNGGKPPRADGNKITEYLNWASAYLGVVAGASSGDPVATVRALLNYVPAAYAYLADDGDDEVGVLAFTGGCWPETGPVTFQIFTSAQGHAETGWATIDLRFASAARDPLCPFAVGISGNFSPPENTNQVYSAYTMYGRPPYSFQWYRDGSLVGTGSSYATEMGTSGFNLVLTGTDALGATSSSLQSVNPAPPPPPPPPCENPPCMDQTAPTRRPVRPPALKP